MTSQVPESGEDKVGGAEDGVRKPMPGGSAARLIHPTERQNAERAEAIRMAKGRPSGKLIAEWLRVEAELYRELKK
jgi:hypothetical protein